MIAAATAEPAHPAFVARRVAPEVLGGSDDATVGALAAVDEAAGRRLDAVQTAARIAIEGDTEPGPVVLAPVPWLAMVRRSTGRALPSRWWSKGQGAGQVPMLPPNVAGWPGGRAWFASSTRSPAPSSPRRSPSRRPTTTPRSTPPGEATSTRWPTGSGARRPVQRPDRRRPSTAHPTPAPDSPSP